MSSSDNRAGSSQYGNLTCSFEEEEKACGRKVGLWTKLKDDKIASDNAIYSLEHTVVSPDACDLEIFDAIKLARVLAGGRTLHIQGDSTMRQLFEALVCSIPLSLIGPDIPRVSKQGENINTAGPRVGSLFDYLFVVRV